PRRFVSLYSISIGVERASRVCRLRGSGRIAGIAARSATVWWRSPVSRGGTPVDMGGWYQDAPPSVTPRREEPFGFECGMVELERARFQIRRPVRAHR